MIHTDPRIITPATLKLLKALSSDVRLDGFVLVGGTALALQIGHRHSVDIELFTQLPFDVGEMERILVKQYGFMTTDKRQNTLKGFIAEVKVDLLTHQYPYVTPHVIAENITLATPLDISAMKLNAIAISGQRQKDFYDIFYLLEYYSLSQMLDAYGEKYSHSNPLIPLKGLIYFEDIRFDVEPPELIVPVSFSQVKSRILAAVSEPERLFKPQ